MTRSTLSKCVNYTTTKQEILKRIRKKEIKLYSHHFLKVLLADARKVLVGKDSEGYWCVEDTL